MVPIQIERSFLVVSLFICFSTVKLSQGGITDVDENKGTSFFFYQRSEFPRDCYEVLSHCSTSSSDGVYLIKPDGYYEPFEVYCENSLDDGGWTIIQRRHDGSIEFNRTWEAYKNGFGFLSQEHYLGNEKIAHITNQQKYKLRIDITTVSELSYYLTYDSFRISDGFGKYQLVNAGVYNGTTGSNIRWCSTNTVFSSCKCEGTCTDPNCNTTCSSTPSCVCPDGFLIDGDDCIPKEDCGCFLQEADGGQGRVIKEGDEYVNPSCTKRCTCNSGQITCDNTYRCSSDAVCVEIEGMHQCNCIEGFSGNGIQCSRVTSPDCQQDTSDSIQRIHPAGWTKPSFQVMCDSQNGGRWLVFQRRRDSSLNFYRGWSEYETGFGSPDGNFWLGNEKLAALTSQGQYELRIDFVSKSGQHYYAAYSSFSVGDRGTNYRLTVSGYDSSSSVGYDAMAIHNGRPFTTKDRDNDANNSNCASHYTGAWWYESCHRSELNRQFGSLWWNNFPGGRTYIRTTEMKIRRV